MDMSKKWMNKDYLKQFKIGHLVEEEKEVDQKQDGNKAYLRVMEEC
jgi:hypothetical protein